jgi:hypothetical protein
VCCKNHASEGLWAKDSAMYSKKEKGIANIFKNGNEIRVKPIQATCTQFFLNEN